MTSYREERVKDFLCPVRIVRTSSNVKNAEALLDGFEKQNFFKIGNVCKIKGKGYIILDFGKEIYGTLRIMTNRYKDEQPGNNFRIRFGESLTETCAEIGEKGATNDHSTRDITFYMSANADMEWGNTGFRFVRIDFLLEQTYAIHKIVAGFLRTTAEQSGSLVCEGEDRRLNEIYDTAAYTLFLNMQNLIWDGVKRDQHVWVGDFYPEMLGALLAFDNRKIVKESLYAILSHYTLPGWYNGIPSYNIWFMLTANDYIKYTGEADESLNAAVLGNLKLFDKSLDDDGSFHFSRIEKTEWGEYFFEWPCEGTPYAKTGIFYLLKYTLQKIVQEGFFPAKIQAKAKAVYARIKDVRYPKTPVKSVEALRVLCGEDVADGVQLLKTGGAQGCSILFSYFILKALAEHGEGGAAVEIAKAYYGGMLDKGATTFWENFDVAWCEGSGRIDEFPSSGEKDIHGDFGANCYTGFRHSLCHGWSCGVIAFLIENVVGLKVEEKGFAKIKIQPCEGWRGKFACTIPTPYGAMQIARDGCGALHCEIPKGVTVATN